jgi:hypothetical protein
MGAALPSLGKEKRCGDGCLGEVRIFPEQGRAFNAFLFSLTSIMYGIEAFEMALRSNPLQDKSNALRGR